MKARTELFNGHKKAIPNRNNYADKKGCYIVECLDCGEKFNAGQPGNNTGRRWCAIYNDRWWDLHTGFQHGYNLDHVDVGDVPLCKKIKRRMRKEEMF